MHGDAGDDELHGGDDNDKLSGDAGNDKLHGDAGDDELHGGDGNDELYGGIGDDILYGDADADNLYGEADADILHGGAGDKLYGGEGNDLALAEGGEALIDGGLGTDFAAADPQAEVTALLNGLNSTDPDSGLHNTEVVVTNGSLTSLSQPELSSLGMSLAGDSLKLDGVTTTTDEQGKTTVTAEEGGTWQPDTSEKAPDGFVEATHSSNSTEDMTILVNQQILQNGG